MLSIYEKQFNICTKRMQARIGTSECCVSDWNNEMFNKRPLFALVLLNLLALTKPILLRFYRTSS